jgi:hypothetical protein
MKKALFFLLALVMLSGALALEDTSDYLACWDFDSGTLLSDANGVHNFTNYSTTSVAGKLGNARDMSGGNNINATTLALDFTSDKTIELWFYIDACASDCSMIDQWRGDAAGREYAVFIGSAGAYGNKIRTVVEKVSAAGDIIVDSTTSVSTLTGGWHLYTMTYNTTEHQVRVYIDNVLEGNNTVPTTLQNLAHKFQIGKSSVSTSGFDGKVDVVAVYNSVLTAQERAFNYNSGTGRVCTDRTEGTVTPPSISVAKDKNSNSTSSIWFNWTTTGNYTYSEVYRAGSLVFNGSAKEYNNTGLSPSTTYAFNITACYNSTICNSTTFSLSTGTEPVWQVRAYNEYGQNIPSFTVKWGYKSGAIFFDLGEVSTTNGTVNTGELANSTTAYWVHITATNYVFSTYYPISAASVTNFTLFQVGISSVTYTGNVSYLGSQYVRTLNYSIVYRCNSGTTIDRYIAGGLNYSHTGLACSNATATLTGSYQKQTAGSYVIEFEFNSVADDDNMTTQYTFKEDLVSPTIVNFTYVQSSDFVTPSVNITLRCTDDAAATIGYNTTLNGANILKGNFSNNTLKSNVTNSLINGANSVAAGCADALGETTDSDTFNSLIRTLYIIDEQNNVLFDVQNLSIVKVYLDDNQTSYDFKANNRSNISFVASSNVKLRFELGYLDGTRILRYVDIGLLTNDVRVCANREGVTHYEQILTSASVRPVILRSVFANCLVAADYTRFAYQDALILKAYTYNNLYYLYIFDDGNQVFLASVDGSIATYINLDTLEFKQQGYNIQSTGDVITIAKENANEMRIYYYNIEQDNTALRFAIVRTDTNAVLLNTTTFADPNEATVIFNFATLGTGNETIFKVIVNPTDADGTRTKEAFFNTSGATGGVNSTLIFVVGIFMILFGLSMTATQQTFGWFGALIMIINIAICSMAMAAWYVTFLQAVNVIILVFIVLVMVAKNQVTIGA